MRNSARQPSARRADRDVPHGVPARSRCWCRRTSTVLLHAGGVDGELVRRAPIAVRVDDDADPVRRRSLVAARQHADDLVRLRFERADGDVERRCVVRPPALRSGASASAPSFGSRCRNSVIALALGPDLLGQYRRRSSSVRSRRESRCADGRRRPLAAESRSGGARAEDAAASHGDAMTLPATSMSSTRRILHALA